MPPGKSPLASSYAWADWVNIWRYLSSNGAMVPSLSCWRGPVNVEDGGWPAPRLLPYGNDPSVIDTRPACPVCERSIIAVMRYPNLLIHPERIKADHIVNPKVVIRIMPLAIVEQTVADFLS